MCRSTAILTIVLLSAGCAGNDLSKAGAGLAGVSTVDQEFQSALDQLSMTVDSLAVLIVAPGPDLATRYAGFESDLADLDGKVRALRERVQAMNDRRDEYLDLWIEQMAKIQNVDPKAQAEQRRTQLVTDLIDVNTRGQAVRKAYPPLQSSLHDCQRFLASHLNADGARSLTVELEKIKRAKIEIDLAGKEFRAALKVIIDKLGAPAPK